MTPEENKAIFMEALKFAVDATTLHLTAKYLAPDFKRHDVFKLFRDQSGVTGVKDHMSLVLKAFPDFKLEVLDVFAGEDRICMRYIARGTHTGELMGRPGTGKAVTWEAVNIYRMVDGKIAETWQYMDALGVLQQIGAV